MLKIIDKQIHYLLFMILIISYHPFMMYGYADDKIFSHYLDDKNVFQFLYDRYFTWAARIPIEFISTILTRHSFSIFCIINICVFFLIVWALIELLGIKNKWQKFLTVALVLTYPIQDMSETGWITTSTNYSWTICAILVCSVFLKRYVTNVKWKSSYWFFIAMSLLYSGFHEQSALMMFSVLILFFIGQYGKNKEKTKVIAFLLLLIISSLGIMFFSPSRMARLLMEVNDYMPDFMSFSFIDKIVLGVTRFEKVFIAQPNMIFLWYSVMILILAFFSSKDKTTKMIAAIPVLCSFVYRFACDYVPTLKAIFIQPEDLMSVNYANYNLYLPLLISCVVVISSFYTIYQCLEKSKALMLIFIITAAGCTQVLMGFSPTIYASLRRTSAFLFFTLIYATLYLYKSLDDKSECRTKEIALQGVAYYVCIFALFFYIQNEIYIVMSGL